MENKRLLHQLQRARTPLARQGSETAELIGVCLVVKMEKGRCLLQQKFRRKTGGRSIWDSIAPVSALTVCS